jgi:RNA polymerase sigma factor (sigma-70 family)
MANGQLDLVLRHIRKMVGNGDQEETDQALLARFAEHHEEAVFERLMERHGPMVLGVCRRLLSHEQDAEDVFQATFLVLARKAKSIRRRGSLGSWLYGVAYRLALKLRASAARRQARERQASQMIATQISGQESGARAQESGWADLRPILDEELHRLPNKYRAPLILCYLEGKTNVEAGRLLGWPAGSMSKRLARGRDLLRTRLTNRGLAFSSAGLAALLAENAQAHIPAALWQSSLKAAVLVGAGQALTGVVSTQVGSLVYGVIQTMFMSKLVKVVVGVMLVAGILTMSAQLAMQSNADAQSDNPFQDAAGVGAGPGETQPDLAQVPTNALAFVRIAFHDIWTSDSMKSVREQLTKSEPFQDMEKGLGFPIVDIQTLTFFMLPPGEPSREPTLLLTVSTSQPIAKEKLLGALISDAQEQHYRGKSYFVPKKSAGPVAGPKPKDGSIPAEWRKGVAGPSQPKGHLFFAGEPAIYFASDRLFLIGEERDFPRYFDRLGWAPAQTPLTAGFKLAEKKHALVAVFQISDQVHEEITRRPLPGEAAFLRPLLDVQSGSVVADLDNTAHLKWELSFLNEATAKESKNALATGIDILKRLLNADASGDFKNDELIAAMAKELSAALESTQLTQEKLVVRGTMESKTPLVGMLIPAVQKVRTAAKQQVSMNNLKQIGLAMHNYHDTYGRLPPPAIVDKDGKPLLSWRVAILPFIEQDNLYRQFKLDEPWDSEHNKKLMAQMPSVYAPTKGPVKDPSGTYYQVFIGKDTVFEPGEKITLISITDGTSNTLMVVEAADTVSWTKPEDLTFDPKKPLPKLGAEFPDTFLAGFCDGSVRQLPRNLDANTLRALITRNGGEVVNLP